MKTKPPKRKPSGAKPPPPPPPAGREQSGIDDDLIEDADEPDSGLVRAFLPDSEQTSATVMETPARKPKPSGPVRGGAAAVHEPVDTDDGVEEAAEPSVFVSAQDVLRAATVDALTHAEVPLPSEEPPPTQEPPAKVPDRTRAYGTLDDDPMTMPDGPAALESESVPVDAPDPLPALDSSDLEPVRDATLMGLTATSADSATVSGETVAGETVASETVAAATRRVPPTEAATRRVSRDPDASDDDSTLVPTRARAEDADEERTMMKRAPDIEDERTTMKAAVDPVEDEHTMMKQAPQVADAGFGQAPIVAVDSADVQSSEPLPEAPIAHIDTGAAPEQLSVSGDADLLFTSMHGFMEQELDATPANQGRCRAELLFEMGYLEEVVQRDSARAAARYEKAREADASFVPAMRALRRLYTSEQRWEDVLKVLSAEVEYAAGDQRAGLLTMAGELCWRRLNDREQAIELLNKATTLVPQYRAALSTLRSLYAESGDALAQSSVIERLAALTRDPHQRARYLVEVAELFEFELDDTERAEELYAHAISLNGANEKAFIALTRLYSKHNRYQQLADLLVTDAGREHEPDEMFAELYRAARLSERQLSDEDRASSLLETAAALRPGDRLGLLALATLYQRSGRHAELASTLERLLPLAADTSERAELHFRLGNLYQLRMQDPDQAISSYQAALEAKSDHEPSIRALADAYLRKGDFSALLGIELSRAERYRDDKARATGYVRAARIAESSPELAARAVELYQRAWKLCPEQLGPYHALERIYRRDKQWTDLVLLLEERAAKTSDPSARVPVLREVARLYEERLEVLGRARETLKRIVELTPKDRETRIHMARLCEAQQDLPGLAEALEAWVEISSDDAERLELWVRLGDLYQGKLANPQRAMELYQKALKIDPRNEAARDQLKQLVSKDGDWRELIDLLSGEHEQATADSDKAAIDVALGALYETKTADYDKARASYLAALERDPHFTPAQVALENMLYRRGDWRPLVELLVRRAEQSTRPAVAASSLCLAAEVYEEQLEDVKSAESLYARAVEMDQSCIAAQKGLERIYLSSAEPQALESHYLRQAERAANPLLRVRAYLSLGALFRGVTKDESAAETAYRSVLKVEGAQADALHSLLAIARRTSNKTALVELLGKHAGETHDRLSAVAALRECAALIEMGEPSKWDLLAIYQRILEGDPHDVRAMAALDAMFHQRGDLRGMLDLALRDLKVVSTAEVGASLAVRAAVLLIASDKAEDAVRVLAYAVEVSPHYVPALRLLRRLHEQLENWREAASLLLREGDILSDPEARASALVRAGSIYLDRFGEHEVARGTFERVFVSNPGNSAAFGRLAEILSGQELWSELVGLYRNRISAIDAGERGALLMQLALIFRDRLADLDNALATLETVLGYEPDNAEALTAASNLAMRTERWRDAESFLERLGAADARQRRWAMRERAKILNEKLGDEDAALEVLQSLIAEDPEDLNVLSQLAVLYRKRADWHRAAGIMEKLVNEGSTDERFERFGELATLYAGELADQEAMWRTLVQMASLAVFTGEGIDRVNGFFERRGDFEGLAQLWGRALAKPKRGSKGVVDARLARARILAGRLLQPDAAKQEVAAALKKAPNSVPARLELAGMHLWSDDLKAAQDEYLRVLARDPFNVDAYRGAFRVAERQEDLQRAAAIAQAIAAVGEPDEAERRLADQLAAGVRSSLTGDKQLALSGYMRLLAHNDESKAGRELMLMMFPHLYDIFRAECEQATGGSFVPLQDDPAVQRCNALATALGIDGRVEVCVSADAGVLAEALPGDRPRIVIQQRFLERAPEAEFRFAVGRALCEWLTQSLYLRLVSRKKLEVMLAATAEIFEDGFADYLGRAEDVAEYSKIVHKALPRRVRKSLEETARAYVAKGPPALAAWRDGARRGAERVGLLLSGDLRAAHRVLTSEKAEKAAIAELFIFSLSPRFQSARKRIGLTN